MNVIHIALTFIDIVRKLQQILCLSICASFWLVFTLQKKTNKVNSISNKCQYIVKIMPNRFKQLGSHHWERHRLKGKERERETKREREWEKEREREGERIYTKKTEKEIYRRIKILSDYNISWFYCAKRSHTIADFVLIYREFVS